MLGSGPLLIAGIGTDLARVSRMQRGLGRWGDRFALRILGIGEQEEFRASAQPAEFLAKRFAAKEAFAKALGTGFCHGLRLTEIQVRHDAEGRPWLGLSGRAQQMYQALGGEASHLSLSDEGDFALAFVVLERSG